MYVDESGDPGLCPSSPTRFFALSGLVIHEVRWSDCYEELKAFRLFLRDRYGLKLKEEFHASEFIHNTRESLLRIPRRIRWIILQKFAYNLLTLNDLRIINIVVAKEGKVPDFNVFETAWRLIVQRFSDTIRYHNFPCHQETDEYGIILPDNTDKTKLKRLVRKMRRVNIIPHSQGWKEKHAQENGYRDIPLPNIIEDPVFKDSYDSYFIQAVDLCAYLLYQYLVPNQFMQRANRKSFFLKLTPILCTHASSKDPLGIVQI